MGAARLMWIVALCVFAGVCAPAGWGQVDGLGPGVGGGGVGVVGPTVDAGSDGAGEGSDGAGDVEGDGGGSGERFDLSSPRAALRSLMAAARAGDFERARRAVDLEFVSSWADEGSRYVAGGLESFEVENAVERFAAVVGRFPREAREGLIGAEVNALPTRAYPQDLVGEFDGRRVTIELVFARGEDGGWRVAEPSLSNADALFDKLDPVRSRLRRDGLGWMIDGSFLGLAYYQWAGLFVLVLLGVFVDLVLRTVSAVVVRRYLRRSEDSSTRGDTGAMITRMGRMVGLVGGALFVYFAMPLLALPSEAGSLLRGVASVVASLSALVFAYRLVDVVAEYFERKTAKTDSTFDDLLVPLIRKAVKVFIFAAGVVAVAEAFDLPITSLVAGLGIGGLAVAFAAKDTVENLFGSVAVVLDRPFDVGDWVVIDEVEGTVEELGFRSTRIRTFYNSLVTVPNSALVRAKVDNYGRRSFRRYTTTLTLTYGTPPDLVEAFCEGVRELIRTHPHTRKDYYLVYFRDFGAHSLDVMVYMFFRTPDWDAECRERHRLGLDILRLAHELGVSFAFPTQTVELVRSGGGGDELVSVGDGSEGAARTFGREAAAAVVSRGKDG